jgi:hypothetical protein
MDIELTKLIVPAITGLLAGTIASLVAPWVNWGIEKKRKSLEYRQSLIKDVRQLTDKAETLEEILSSSLWGFIESHLTKDEQHAVSSGRVLHATDYDGLSELHMRKQKISKMLSRLEKQWKLNT